MHKNTRLLPYQKREIYRRWKQGEKVARLARDFLVSRPTVYKVLKSARLGIFIQRASMNYRYRSVYFGLRRLLRTERILAQKMARKEHRLKRYEKAEPGEMAHFDTKKLPLLPGEAITQPREHLHVAVDDYSRWVYADILPDKTSYSAAIHLEETRRALPFRIQCAYSDNGSEYKGRKDHIFVGTCLKYQIGQKFTKPHHPYTNGKAERMIKTLMTEWHRKYRFNSRDERRRILYAYINWYNQSRPHQSLNGQSPLERLEEFISRARLKAKM